MKAHACAFLLAGFLAAPFLGVSAQAATITATSSTVSSANDAAQICVGLELDAADDIAGTQNELSWDASCATLVVERCRANPTHGKSLSAALQNAGLYKALVLSFDDVDPIPAGELYCCDFVIHAAPGSCCAISIGEPGAGDPKGDVVEVAAGPDGMACLAGNSMTPASTATPTRSATAVVDTPTPTATFSTPTPVSSPPPSIRTRTATAVSASNTRTPVEQEQRTRKPTATRGAGSDDDGCAVTRPTEGRPAASLAVLLVVPLLVACRRRRQRP